MEKKRIAILIVGESRNNSLGIGSNLFFVNNFKQHVLNGEY